MHRGCITCSPVCFAIFSVVLFCTFHRLFSAEKEDHKVWGATKRGARTANDHFTPHSFPRSTTHLLCVWRCRCWRRRRAVFGWHSLSSSLSFPDALVSRIEFSVDGRRLSFDRSKHCTSLRVLPLFFFPFVSMCFRCDLFSKQSKKTKTKLIIKEEKPNRKQWNPFFF